MKRFDVELFEDGPSYDPMVASKDGDWVEYDEAAAEIERLKDVIRDARDCQVYWGCGIKPLEDEINSWEEDDES